MKQENILELYRVAEMLQKELDSCIVQPLWVGESQPSVLQNFSG